MLLKSTIVHVVPVAYTDALGFLYKHVIGALVSSSQYNQPNREYRILPIKGALPNKGAPPRGGWVGGGVGGVWVGRVAVIWWL